MKRMNEAVQKEQGVKERIARAVAGIFIREADKGLEACKMIYLFEPTYDPDIIVRNMQAK